MEGEEGWGGGVKGGGVTVGGVMREEGCEWRKEGMQERCGPRS